MSEYKAIIDGSTLAVEPGAEGAESAGGISQNGHRLTRNGQTWTCMRCHEPAPNPDEYGRTVCVPAEEGQHRMR